MENKWFSFAVRLAIHAVCGGAANEKHPFQLADKNLVDGPLAIPNRSPNDKVLRGNRTASPRPTGACGQANGLQDSVLLSLGRNVGKGKNAKMPRGLFLKESSKDYHGESYEHVMANCYRSILYMLEGEADEGHLTCC